MSKYVLGIDIGGTNIRMGLVDEAFHLDCFERYACKEVLQNQPLESLAGAIRDYLGRNAAGREIAAVSVGVPAVVNKNHSYVYSAPNVYGLDSLDLGRELEKLIDLPVLVDRDVNFILAYDIQIRDLDPDHAKTILGCYLGTGFGNALHINGRIHLGSHGSAGELGHIPLYGVEKRCPCGQKGCVEAYISGRYLQELCSEAFPGEDMTYVFQTHGDDERIIRFVKDIAIPVATEATLLDPDYIILGGGVLAMPGFPMEALIEEITQRSRHPLPAEDLHFVVAEASQSCGVVGGAIVTHGYLKEGKPFHT